MFEGSGWMGYWKRLAWLYFGQHSVLDAGPIPQLGEQDEVYARPGHLPKLFAFSQGFGGETAAAICGFVMAIYDVEMMAGMKVSTWNGKLYISWATNRD